MTQTPEQIAAGLTKAQRWALLRSAYYEDRSAYKTAGRYLTADKRVRWALCCAGVIYDYLNPVQKLTPLGQQVRAILENQHE